MVRNIDGNTFDILEIADFWNGSYNYSEKYYFPLIIERNNGKI